MKRKFAVGVLALTCIIFLCVIAPSLNPPRQRVIIWFDDGLKTTYTIAFPIMKRYGYVGVVAVICGEVGKVWDDGEWRDKECISLTELEALQDAGWDIVSHGFTHTDLSTLSREDVLWELTESKDWIDEHGFSSSVFAYPCGRIGDYRHLTFEHYRYDRTGESVCESITIGHETVYNEVLADYEHFIFHDILDARIEPWDTPVDEFEAVLNDIYERDLEVKTISEGLR